MDLNQEEFESFRRYIYQLCGLSIQEDKKYLVRYRLEPLVKRSGCANFGDFFKMVSVEIRDSEKKNQLEKQIVDAITTHETSFFRDLHPFRTIRDYIFPKLVESKQKSAGSLSTQKIRIWSVGSSTGEEPFSLAILIHEFLRTNPEIGLTPNNFEILATDISEAVIKKSKLGKYSYQQVKRGIKSEYLDRYFELRGKCYHVNDSLAKMIRFQQLNLIDPIPNLGIFDLILCRNVLIYFDDLLIKQVMSQLYEMLTFDSWLILGASENIYEMKSHYRSIRKGGSTIYKKSKIQTTLH